MRHACLVISNVIVGCDDVKSALSTRCVPILPGPKHDYPLSLL